MFPGVAGTAHDTTAEPPDSAGPKVRTHVRFADEFDDEYEAETDGSESAQAERVFFDDEDGDDDPGGGDGDMQQQVGESSDPLLCAHNPPGVCRIVRRTRNAANDWLAPSVSSLRYLAD